MYNQPLPNSSLLMVSISFSYKTMLSFLYLQDLFVYFCLPLYNVCLGIVILEMNFFLLVVRKY